LNIGTAFSVFLVSVVILSTNYKTIWPAPNFVTHSATFDYIYQDFALRSYPGGQVSVDYAYPSTPIPTVTWNLLNHSHHADLLEHQSVLEKQSNLHHLHHIPPWALVPDRVRSSSGSASDLQKLFDSVRAAQEDVLSALSDVIEVIPTESVLRTQMEKLSASQKYWIRNMTEGLFNASQSIFAYQWTEYAEEIQQWVQNDGRSNVYLRALYERTRGWPLLYNPSVPQQTEAMERHYRSLCEEHIVEAVGGDEHHSELTVEQCELMLDAVIPWMPDKSPSLTTMWPKHYEVEVEALSAIKGINSPYTLVLRQRKKPSGELLHYVSPKGDERIQVEWFNERHHLRATNLAFVRRIRVQIKRISNALRNGVTLSGEDLDPEDELAALWASLEEEEEEGPKPSDRHIEQLPGMFKDYVKAYAAELEKGQFEEILNMDLAQNDNVENKDVFIHGLPTLSVFNDGGIKRAWNMIIGVVDHDLMPAPSTQHHTARTMAFMERMKMEQIQAPHHRAAHGIELEIVGIWPYAVGGYLRAITPEVAVYRYPHFADAVRVFGKQRSVLLLDVLDKLYNNNMRQIGIQRLVHSDDANLITLKSTVQYLCNMLSIEHRHFHDRDEHGRAHSLTQGVFIRLTALVQCAVSGDDGEDKKDGNGGNEQYGCLLSGVMFHIIEGIVREDSYSLTLIALLEKEGLIEWTQSATKKKDIVNVVHGEEMKRWTEEREWKQWREGYFGSDGAEETLTALQREFEADETVQKRYARITRHISKYAVLQRPGEDTFVLQ